jgi:hypothetical protein
MDKTNDKAGKLKPCPFCDSRPYPTAFGYWGIQHFENCFMRTVSGIFNKILYEDYSDWNRRPSEEGEEK